MSRAVFVRSTAAVGKSVTSRQADYTRVMVFFCSWLLLSHRNNEAVNRSLVTVAGNLEMLYGMGIR
jgi:hypothetical protein